MASKERFFDSLTIVALACALVTTGLVVRREFFEPDEASAEIGPIPLADWSTYLAGGHRLGPDSAPVTILTFSDFQCPACRKFAVKTWPAIRKQFATKLRSSIDITPSRTTRPHTLRRVLPNARRARTSSSHSTTFCTHSRTRSRRKPGFSLPLTPASVIWLHLNDVQLTPRHRRVWMPI
jgi:hypothetical protein